MTENTENSELSLAEQLAKQPLEQQREILNQFDPQTILLLRYDWGFWSRPKQKTPDGDWATWIILAGRGYGKSRVLSEWVRQQVEPAKEKLRGAIVGPTADAVRKVVIEGDSGILACAPPDFRPIYEPSLRQLTWPNGCIAVLYSAEEPERLRGPQHHWAICDELCAWNKMEEAWDMLSLGLRLGDHPRRVVATTPKPVKLLKQIMTDVDTVVTRGSTHENRNNLAPGFFKSVVSRYDGTRLGRQEIEGEFIEEAEGALWSREMLERARFGTDGQILTQPPALKRIVVAVDPAVTAKENSDATGIVAAGLGEDGRAYVLADASGKYTPDGWARKAIGLYESLKADRIVAEGNQGGEMVRHTIQSVRSSTPVQIVHATRGKAARAEPIAALYEQSKISHCGIFPELEDQLCTWEPLGNLPSPDRMDALVWALTALMLNTRKPAAFGKWGSVVK